ncbi:UNVERIFIED_CONTAM: hypothetical protein FKN15_035344 [Acipenser sinensis]
MALQMQNAKENIEVLAKIKENTLYQTPVKTEPATDDDQADVEWERRGPLEQEVVAADSEEVMSNTLGIKMLESTSDEEGSVSAKAGAEDDTKLDNTVNDLGTETPVKTEPATDDDQADVEWERRGPLEQEVVAADSEEVMSNTLGIKMLESTSDEEGSVQGERYAE